MKNKNTMISIEQISINDVYMYQSERFNTNNHWKNNEQPSDYYNVLAKTKTCNWIQRLKSDYQTIDLDLDDFNWMKQAFMIGKFTGKFPSMYQYNLNQMIKKYQYLNNLFIDKKYFVRVNNVSLKYGLNGCGPYTEFKNIIESIVSSIDGHSPFNNPDALRIYLIPWVTIDDDKEFRVFCNNNTITAISQQNLYQTNQTIKINQDKNILINKWINIIVNYFNTNIHDVISDIGSYCMDIALIGDDDIPYFIELNSFGAEYAAGSALFHWIIDKEKLYDSRESNTIYFRYCG